MTAATVFTMMSWKVLKNFGEQWDAIQELKNAEKKPTPKIGKQLNILKFFEAFNNSNHT